MPKPRWRLILNGKSAGDDALREAVGAIRDRGIVLDVRVTWESGDAERYVSEAIADGVATIIAAGGDGTLSEVATTLAHRDESADVLPSLGLVPLGTANDFASAALIPTDPAQALDLIDRQAPRPIDLIRLEAPDGLHWAANLASGGFGTQVTIETDAGLKKMLGGLAYLVTGISKLGKIEPMRARLHGDGFEWEGDFIALGIGNGKQAGGGQALCPDALIDDGLLDVTVVPELSGEVGATVRTLLTEGKHAALDRVAARAQLKYVEIDSPQGLTLNLDGEPVHAHHFRIDCVPARLRMHLPADCPLLSASAAQALPGALATESDR
ncbi:lipid kinase YegS [Lysobacter capsici]|uniref:Probable lipid kinase YegS-like n=1 Tax=Lysobacter capsici AZ78 TaxID=1444315 RepID=A0A108UCT2_9GAMM|nr:lipid kinase YegS [Lysobacter capsici]ALN87670.1 lipid kinase YegS [Lysobacter capsici]KWS06540.1 Transcription regulator [Lysobacter capsici AZ78]WND79646.1 lipid kinase YegS [Lysobacter capsici]WND84842.1 lipid kinase YegS [Lysobacter capsici]